MSYILDALKRADAERERGHVPGLHAQPLQAPRGPGGVPGQRRGAWLLLAGAVALGGIFAAVWVWRGPAGDAGTKAVEMPQTKAAMAIAAQPSAPAPVAAPTVPPAPIAITSPPAPPAMPGPPVSPPVAAPPPVEAPVAPTAPPTTKPPSATLQAPALAPPAKPSAPPASAATAPLLSELPEDLRRQIPPLAITGAVYSANPSQRLLLVNGQVIPQGASAAAEVTIEEIQARSSVFSFRGTRFRVAH